MGLAEEAWLAREAEREEWEQQMMESEEEAAEREQAEDAYARRKQALEEDLGMHDTHLSLERLRLLLEYNREDERNAA